MRCLILSGRNKSARKHPDQEGRSGGKLDDFGVCPEEFQNENINRIFEYCRFSDFIYGLPELTGKHCRVQDECHNENNCNGPEDAVQESVAHEAIVTLGRHLISPFCFTEHWNA